MKIAYISTRKIIINLVTNYQKKYNKISKLYLNEKKRILEKERKKVTLIITSLKYKIFNSYVYYIFR